MDRVKLPQKGTDGSDPILRPHTNAHNRIHSTTNTVRHITTPHIMTFSFNQLCVHGKEECSLVQTELCELARTPPTTAAADNESPSTVADVWCQPTPFKITFNPHTSNYKGWLLVLSLCHHIPAFKKQFLSMTEFAPTCDIKKISINGLSTGFTSLERFLRTV